MFSGGNRGAKIAQLETNLYKARIRFKMFLHISILLRQNPPCQSPWGIFVILNQRWVLRDQNFVNNNNGFLRNVYFSFELMRYYWN